MEKEKIEPQDHRKKYVQLLDALFWKAFKANSFDSVCTLLRVGGISDANWDPFEESRNAFDDFNWVLEKSIEEKSKECQRRIRLLMYCQAIEMTAPPKILANLLRCSNNNHYVVNPFGHLRRSKKNKLFSWVPPSAKSKFKEIKRLAEEGDEPNLIEAIDTFFDENVRNAFSHSDYILTTDHFRYTEGGLAQQIEVNKLDAQISECFKFYGAFLSLHKHWLQQLGKAKKFHKWPQYEVLELLSDENDGLYGFNVHFSNGSKATYTRRKSGIEAINLTFENDGGINFMCGPLDALESVHKINGEVVKSWETLP